MNKNRHIIIIILLSLIARAIVILVLNRQLDPGILEYEILALNMLKHGTFSMQFREYGEFKGVIAPGYSLLIYCIYAIFGIHREILLLLQIASMTLFALIIYGIAEKCLKNRSMALVAAILTILHPGLLYYNILYIHNYNIYLPLFYATILLFIMALRNNSGKPLLWAGVTAGISTLTRATFSPIFVVCLAFYLIFKRDVALRKKMIYVISSFLIFAAINMPWAVRNYMQFGKLIYSQNTKWESFWVGNNPNASGGHFHADGTLVLATKPPEMQDEINANKGDEIAIEEVFKKYSLQYAKSQPFHFVKGLIRKSFYFWWFYPQTGLFYPKSYLLAYKGIYIALLIFTAIGLYFCHKEKLWCSEMIFPALLVLGIWAAHTMNFMEMRHRWTIEPVLIIFASVGVWKTIRAVCKYSLKDGVQ
jgi:4-amino-4-deoxy-L-arabinose transferase-like glycosyltransferase